MVIAFDLPHDRIENALWLAGFWGVTTVVSREESKPGMSTVAAMAEQPWRAKAYARLLVPSDAHIREVAGT